MDLGMDDVVIISSAGGGGHGPAGERDVASVIADVEEGYVTVEGALRDYGMDLTGGTVDEYRASARAGIAAQGVKTEWSQSRPLSEQSLHAQGAGR